MQREPIEFERLLTPAEAGRMLRLTPITIRAWCNKGMFPEGTVIRTPGGHRRLKESVVLAIVNGDELR